MTNTETAGPVRSIERALVPDLARGSMLLLIALANAVGVVFAAAPGVGPVTHWYERALNLVMFTLVNARAYPVFAVMFGYGLVQLTRRQAATGASTSTIRTILLRRNTALIAFGAVHGVLFYFGDFLGAYGIVGTVMAVLVLPRGEKVQRIVLGLWALAAVELSYFALRSILLMSHGLGGSAGVPTSRSPSLAAPDYLASLLARLTEWPAHTLSVVPFIVIVWLGSLAARRRILEEPDRHLTVLRGVAAGGLGIAAVGGLPLALVSAGWSGVDEPTADALSTLSNVSGMFAGPGYVALLALLGRRLTRDHAVVAALCALGQRSLSGYLFQSLAWTLLLMPYSLALAAGSVSPLMVGALVAVTVWLISVLGAVALEWRDLPGPAERLLRRLTYGTRP
jgi:uncharacterized membrane protein YeiB